MQPQAAAGGFSFGSKYISQVSGNAPSPSAAPSASALIPSELDGQLSQQLQKLSKRDAITRLKALQTLNELIKVKSSSDMGPMLGPWAYYFARLIMDAHRGVRAEACAVMGAVAVAVGRALAPYLKLLIPPWYIACYDASREVAAAASAALETALPAPKSRDALLFCRAEVSQRGMVFSLRL